METERMNYLGIGRDPTYYAINRKPDVILLNGLSSAGKSSIAKGMLQKLRVSGRTIIISLDDYLQMSTNEPIPPDVLTDSPEKEAAVWIRSR